MPSIAEQRARIAELASRMIAKNPGNAGAIMQQLRGAGLDISGNPLPPGPFQMPNVPPAGGLSYTGVMSGDQLGPLAKYAGRTPAAPPGAGLTPEDMAIPFNGTGGDPNSLRSMADRGDPSQAPDFRSRLNAAMDTAGVQLPGPKFSTQGVRPDLSGYDRGSPPSFRGNLPRTRPPEQLTPGAPPPPMAGAGPPSPLAQAGGPSPLPGAGPPAPIIGREAPPGLNGPPSPLASRFGDQSQLPGGAFSGSLPQSPRPRPFESMIAARPEGPPSGFPAAPPSMAQGPIPGSETMGPPSPLASRFGDQSQLAGGAFSGGAPPPMAGGPAPPAMASGSPIPTSVATQGGFKPAPGFDQALRSVPPPASLPPLPPSAMDARVGAVSPETTLPPSAMDARVGATTPSAALSPLQRSPLNLAAGAGVSGPPPPLGSTNQPFATSAPFGSVGQRMTDAGLPLEVRPVRSTEAPLISVPAAGGTDPVGAVTSQAVPPPSPTAAIPPANIQTGNLNDVLALSGTAPPPAIVGQQAGQRTAGPPRGKGARQSFPVDRPFPGGPPAPPPVVPAQEQQKPFWNAPNIATMVGAGAGLLAGGGGGAVTGAAGGRVIGKVIQAIRNRGQTVDAKGNIIDKAGNVIGHVSDMLGKAGSGLGGIFGGGGSAGSGGMGMGGWGGSGGWGGGSSYTGGNYGGNAGGNINQGIGQRFGQR